MKPRSFSPRSTAAQTMCTSGWWSWARLIPGGRGDDADERDDCAPASLTASIAAPLEWPVASIGSSTIASRSSEVDRQLHEVLDRLQRLLVAVQPDEADARARHEREHAVEHAHARAQHRADGDLLARDPLRRHLLERRLDLVRLRRHVLRRLVREQQRQLVHELAEVDGRRLLVPQVAELVLDERVRDDGEAAASRSCRNHYAPPLDLFNRPEEAPSNQTRSGSRDVRRVAAEAGIQRPGGAERVARATRPSSPSRRAPRR